MDNVPDRCTEEAQCQKKDAKKDKRSLTYGVLLVICQYQKCYGFHLMVESEGRKDVYTILYEYMPNCVLHSLHIIYDFGCNLREYMLNWEPLLFQHVMVYIDRFHFKGHKCFKLCSLDTNAYLLWVLFYFLLEST